ncbi:hypothetical protein WBJ53_09175 [Spirosoma sp. SC4-14]|uniref:hypothetical protein n=1 Tax=Spirosoma sp. SC4-14 TaxID=3128900 RepID=UPI0030D11036
MATKSLDKILNQLPGNEGEETEGFSEITPEEAEELSGGLSDIDVNGACGNRGCPVSNTGCK